ncbi:MAG: hypothetical protein NWE86_07300 [Candidatus Bathyarchaeota archaeon]|nr:hypothetical protein [Candidatus Bathyarchaeota archaeon]
MDKPERIGLSVGVIESIGLGLLLRSEYSGKFMTLVGAGLLILSLICLGAFSYKKKRIT